MKKLYSLTPEQKEATKHGESFFPIQKYITRLPTDIAAVLPHWHEEAELTLITKGDCVYQIDLTEYSAHEGDLLFIPPLYLHSISKGVSSEMLSETYVFHLNYLGGNSTDICSTRYLVPMMNQEFSMPYLITPAHPAYAALKAAFHQISDLFHGTVPGYELALKSMLLQSCFIMLQYSQKTDTPDIGTPSDMIKAVLDYVENHYAEAISVTELARLCHFSDYHFMRFFKKYMNMTCIEYINNLRLEKSIELFEQGNTSIIDVSMSVGFHNLSYFHRAFKKKYQMTPRTFIKTLTR